MRPNIGDDEQHDPTLRSVLRSERREQRRDEQGRWLSVASAVDDGPFLRLRKKDRPRFLVLISEGYSITRAAQTLGYPRTVFQQALDDDPTFRAAYEQAFEASADKLEDEAWRRSYERGRFRLGSDRLLELSLKARRPHRYSERVQHSGPGGGPLKAVVAHVDYAATLDVLAEAGLIALPEASEG